MARKELSVKKNKDFQPSGLGKTIFEERYARHKNETWEEACKRVANHVAQAENNGKIQRYEDRFYQQLSANKFMPGGRIWYGSGRPKAQLLNCFVVPTQDSREGWGEVVKEVIIISGLGGGVGINFSSIRPRGSEIKGTGGFATGAVSLMHMVDRVGDVIVSGGGRRLALMMCLDLTHPDLEEFLDSKTDLQKLNNANISVVLDIPAEEFVKKVQNDETLELKFSGQKPQAEISAREIWQKIVENAWDNGEPGVLNGHFANEMNNIHYHKELISTNPCGEIWLEEYGCCDLGALVLPKFVQDGNFDWDSFDESVRLGTRFLDNVLDVNFYPFDKIKENCEQVRRIGLGVMGLHTMLMDLGLKYSSQEGREFIDRLFSTLKNTAYDASINLAIEKGTFPAFNTDLLNSGFAKTLKRGIRNKIKEHGLRNCAVLTIAPTGTTSMVAGVSSGIEPLPAVVYWRTFFSQESDTGRKKELVIDDAYHKYGSDLIESAADLSPRDHFEIQKICQKHTDNAVSKTINLPEDYPIDDLADLWLEYLPYIKGSTFYRWGSRDFEPISPIPKDQWEGIIDEATTKELEEILDCPKGSCEI